MAAKDIWRSISYYGSKRKQKKLIVNYDKSE